MSVAAEHYTDFKLYSYWRSSSTWRVRVALAAKAVPFETCAVNLLKGEQKSNEQFTKLNLMKQVPVLEFKDTVTKKLVRVTQSIAIIEFLEDAFPNQGGTLLPRDPVDRAAAREMAEVVNAGTQPLQNLSVFTRIDEESAGAMSGRAFARDAIENGLRSLEALVLHRRNDLGESCGPYAIGTFVPTIADACIVPQMYNGRRFQVDIEKVCPTLLEVEKAAMDHVWFKASHPDAQPDAVVAGEQPQKKSKTDQLDGVGGSK